MHLERYVYVCKGIHSSMEVHALIYTDHGSKPLARSKISEISHWQKCFSELKISNPRISCTLNGVRRGS